MIMTAWDVLNNVITSFPFIVTALFLVAALIAVVIFIVGFSRHGVDFLRHGFRQKNITDLGEKIDKLHTEFKTALDGFKIELDGFSTELETIKVNHFGHLKNYLGILNGVLLDKEIIDNETRARLDNELRGM
jgi:hypothetical protein